jgi:outer membrane receptor protein involved in Fe transport
MLSRKSVRFAVVTALAAGSSIATSAFAQESPASEESQEVQSVVITGTLIRRSEGFTPASPVQELTREDFEAHAPRTVAEYLTELPYNFNSSTGVGRLGTGGSSNGSGSLNLRNLGSTATLVLLNSRRVARDAVTVNNVDVNALVPQIAIERIEVLKDGASSIYGSDAVAGVANFLTRRNFSGFEVQAQGDMREYGHSVDSRFGAIWGAQGEKGGVVASFEYFKRSPYYWDSLGVVRDNLDNTNGQFLIAGWPDRFAVPNRDAGGALTGSALTLADPLCSAFTANAVASGSVTRFGTTYPTSCLQNTAFQTSTNADEDRYQAFFEVHHDFNDSLRFFGEAGVLQTRVLVVDNPGGAVNVGPGQPPVVIPGYAPSNPFRAMSSAGQPLYAQNSGVRLGYDKDGVGGNDYLPARDGSGRVIVVGTDPNALGANGLPVVPFWEDTTLVAGSRIFGLNCNLPGDPASTDNCRQHLDPTRYEVNMMRFALGVEGELFGGDNWHYSSSYVWASNEEDDTTFASGFSMPNLRAALAGYGGPGCLTTSIDPLTAGASAPGAGTCQFLNVFGTSVTTTPGSLLANTVDMVHYVTAQDWQRFRTVSQAFDFVLSGNLFSLPAGKVGIAIGGQHRQDAWSADFPALQNAGQSDLQLPYFDKDVTQSINAIFAELSVPVMASDQRGSLDFTGAIRRENTGGPGLASTDPKFGLLYATPGARFKARATWSTSFLAASLYQRYRESAAFTSSVNDVLTPQNDNLARVPTITNGNPNLEPQSSKNYNLGVTFRPYDPLTVDIDYWHFTFDDQIAPQNAVELAANLETATDPNIVIRDPSAGVVMYNGVNVGPIVGFNTTYVNNASLETGGIDFEIHHRQNLGRFGSLRTALLATYQTTYKLNGQDLSDSRNARTGGSYAIPWRATLSNTWSFGEGALQSLVRFTDGYDNDQLPNPNTPAYPHIGSYVTWDLAYSYGLGSLLGLKSSEVALGINNVMDRQGVWLPDSNHTMPNIYDYSGRHIWLRLKAAF